LNQYKLEQKEEIKHTFGKLIKTDFYKFITLNCETMKIDNITDITGKSRVKSTSGTGRKYWTSWGFTMMARI